MKTENDTIKKMSEVTIQSSSRPESTTALVLTSEEVRKELRLSEPAKIQIEAGEERDLAAQADQFVTQLVNFDSTHTEDQNERKTAVEQMAQEVQKGASKQSALLRQPIKVLSQRGEEGGDVANALINLKVKVEELDPGKFDFEPGWVSRTLGKLPGVGTPMKRYFSKYESAQTVIAAIIRSLEVGKDQLQRDNITLIEDQRQMREMTHKLERAVRLGQMIDQKLQYKLEREIPPSDPKHRFVNEELLFPLRQRIIDLQQQLAVNQQGVLATEIIMRNNKELVRGVNRSLNVTVTALEVGATVAMALANQKIVLEKIESVSKTTSDLIAGTAARLKTQGVDIQKQAATTQLNIDSLKSAFADIKTAIDDVSNFREKALPQMANTILEMDKLSADAEQSMKKLESGNQAKSKIKIEVDSI